MDPIDIILETEEPMHNIRSCYERAHLLVSDLVTNYFNTNITSLEQQLMSLEFHKAAVRSDIIVDTVLQLGEALKQLEAFFAQIQRMSKEAPHVP